MIGMPRSGTTWLHRRLSRHSRIVTALGGIKEVHYFDTVDRFGPDRSIAYQRLDENRHQRRLARFAMQIARLETQLNSDPPEPRRSMLQRRLCQSRDFVDRFAESDAWYAELFEPGPGDWCLDSTPAYHRLSEAALQRLNSVAGEVRAVLLLRDPYHRALSAVRHRVARGKLAFGSWMEERQRRFCREVIADGYAIPHIERIRRIIPADRLQIVFSERMFSEPTEIVADILAGADLSLETACMEDAACVPNPSPPVPFSDDLRRFIFAQTRPMANGVRELGLGPPASWSDMD